MSNEVKNSSDYFVLLGTMLDSSDTLERCEVFIRLMSEYVDHDHSLVMEIRGNRTCDLLSTGKLDVAELVCAQKLDYMRGWYAVSSLLDFLESSEYENGYPAKNIQDFIKSNVVYMIDYLENSFLLISENESNPKLSSEESGAAAMFLKLLKKLT